MLLAALLLPTIWIVDATNGPGTNFLDLSSAVATAVNGDTLLVRPGIYAGTTLANRALTIRGAGATWTHIGPLTIDTVPTNGQLVIAGVAFDPIVASNQPTLTVHGPGIVMLVDCQVLGMSGPTGMAAMHADAAVTLQTTRCTFRGGSANGIAVTQQYGGNGILLGSLSRLTAVDCQFLGGDSLPIVPGTPNLGGSGLIVAGADANLNNTRCTGGTSAYSLFATPGWGGHGVWVQGGTARIGGGAAAQLRGGTSYGPSGALPAQCGYAIFAATGAAIGLDGIVLQSAAAGAPLTSGNVMLGAPRAPSLAYSASQLPSGETAASATATLSFAGVVPDAAFFLMIGFRSGYAPPLDPWLSIDPLSGGWLFGVLDPNAAFAFSFVPAQLLGLYGVPILTQAGTLDPALGVRMSNVDVRIYGP